MTIFITSDYSDIDKEIDRIERMPNRRMVAALDAVLATGFAGVVAGTDVITGSLKSSAKKESGGDKVKQQWTGSIQMGGPSTGVNNPVDYAIYEKARGGEHDFFAGLPGLHPAYIAAILKELAG
jgi:hypothetical protein